jgi:quercetin dioxygenase-like cupin family protein
VVASESRGAACWFANAYGGPPVEFEHLGINVTVLEPGQCSLYHAEVNQEAFLVLTGASTLLMEGEERALKPWDFFHCAPWTEHAFVGAGEGPGAIRWPAPTGAGTCGIRCRSLRRATGRAWGRTSDPDEVYATAEQFRRARPPYWARLPWV